MGKSIFISGGATGIGRAAVIRFISEDWNVTFMDLNREQAEELVREVDQPERLMYIHGDTSIREDTVRAVREAMERFGGLHSVFANAGIHQNNTILNISDEDLNKIISVNIYGTIHVLQASLPELIKGGGGSVVLNCSDQWFVGKPDSFAYGMTKGAIGQIVRSLSIDMAPYNIRVNAVCPGSIDTPLLEGAMRRFATIHDISYEEMMRKESALYARGKVGQPSEVANLVYFLASDQAAFCTGGHYIIDGGLVAG